MSVTIGIIKEGKVPIDRRVPLTPPQVSQMLEQNAGLKVYCQRSDIRCFDNSEYEKAGAILTDDVTDCDIVLGVKEVPIDMLALGKTFFFFSHIIKRQEYNRGLLQEILKKNIRLIDWECLTNKEGRRLIAFGRYAGIVGAYNGILTFGKRYNLFSLRPAHACFDIDDMAKEYAKVKLPPIKIVLTGGGRVAKGSMEVLYGMGIRKVSPAEFLEETFSEPVFTQLNTRNYNRRISDGGFNRDEFYADPVNYESDFLQYQKSRFVNCRRILGSKSSSIVYKEDALENDFKVKVIADITCDIEGSIPSTKQPSTIDDPYYDFNPSNDQCRTCLFG